MCRLLRGTQEELCRTFFDIYDLNGDKKLASSEIIEVYQHLLSSTSRTRMTPAQKAKVRRGAPFGFDCVSLCCRG